MYRPYHDDSRGHTMKPPDKPIRRSTSDPHVFPPIEGLHGREMTRVFSETQPPETESPPGRKPTRFPLPPRYVLYRKWGLVTNGGRGVYTLLEDKPELNKSYTMDAITPSLKKIIRSPVKSLGRPPEVPKRASFTITGKEIPGGKTIRKKIEEFRHWHEEQYKLKVDKAKAKVPSQIPTPRSKAQDAFTLAIINKDKGTAPQVNIAQNANNKQDMNAESAERLAMEPLPTLVTPKSREKHKPEAVRADRLSRDPAGPRAESPPAAVPEELKARIRSSKTWKTWRDVNESYAYNDVKSYIKDNDLMEEDKEKHIRDWVTEVEKAREVGDCVGPDGAVIRSAYLSDSSLSLSDSL